MKKLFLIFFLFNVKAMNAMYRVSRIAAARNVFMPAHPGACDYCVPKTPSRCTALVVVKYPVEPFGCSFQEEQCKRFDEHAARYPLYYGMGNFFGSNKIIRNYALFLYLQKHPECLPIDPEYFPWPNTNLIYNKTWRKIYSERYENNIPFNDGCTPETGPTLEECGQKYYTDVQYRENLEHCCKGDHETMMGRCAIM